MADDDTPASLTAVLLDHLGGQRRHILGALEGLDEEALRSSVLPSGWSPLGLVRHLTHDVERFWFAAVVAADPAVVAEEEAAMAEGADPIDAWQVDAATPAAEVLNAYRAASARSDEIIATHPLEAPPAWWPTELFGSWRMEQVAEVVVHVITETACHAGHLDAARELIDGRSWSTMT